MSKQKVNQLVNVLEEWTSGIVVLRGPSGCGKFTALQAACSHLKIILRLNDQGDFLANLARLDSLAIKQVLCSREPLQSELSTISVQFAIPVVIIEDADLTYRNFPCMQQVVSFNAYSDSAIRGIIQGACISEVPEAILDETVRVANGDARQALIHLEFQGVTLSTEICRITKMKRKRPPVASNSAPRSAPQSGGLRDNSFSLFHTLGKILYNKEKEGTDCISLSSQPVIQDSGQVPILLLHENMPDFTPDVHTLKLICQDMGFWDMYLRFSEHANWFVFRAITIINQNNKADRTVKGFSALRKPMKSLPNNHLLSEIRCELPGMKPTYMHFIDYMMKESAGSFPMLSVQSRRNIYCFTHKNDDWAIESKPGCEVFPSELCDDPICD